MVHTDALDEIGQLSRVFDRMTKSLSNISSVRDGLTRDLQKSNHSLEKEIVDRKKAEATIHSIVETAADAIITVGESGMIERFNYAAEHIFGYRSEEIIGRSISVLMSQRDLLWHVSPGGTKQTLFATP